ncbi:hypothetical protein Leryth_018545 [Lithospermum erythrorhizon]|nr:hypothetical protein Leryth_018545 [Lithospermum erythrorhizon]
MVSSLLYLVAPPLPDVHKYMSLIPNNEDDDLVWHMKFEHVIHLILGAAFLGVLVMIVTLILKLLVNLINSGVERELAVETDLLLPKQVIPFTYGTCDDQEDLESGKGSCSSSEDLYDWKTCVICYDEQKSCFFVPCGHCVTCETCAKRIIEGENKTCPICRQSIRRVKKVLIS